MATMNDGGGRGNIVLAIVVGVAVAGSGGAVGWLLQRDRAALVDQFSATGREQVVELATEAEDGFDDVAEDLAFATALVEGADAVDRSRELTALLAVVRQYRAVVVFDVGGNAVIRISEPPPSTFDAAPYLSAMSATAKLAAERNGEIVTSGHIEGDDAKDGGGWFRVFARGFGDEKRGGALALLVDTRPFFQQVRVLTADASTRVLVLGAYGHPLPLSDAAAIAVAERLPALRARIAGVVAGADRVEGRDAAAVGLGNDDVVVSWAPIPLRGQQHWSVATFRSTTPHLARQREIAWRLAIVVVVFASVVVLVARKLLHNARQETTLRERLAHAERYAALHTELLRAEKLATVGVLAAGMAHEIGTPLGVIRGRAEFVAGKLGEDHPMLDGVKTIVAQSDRVTGLIQGLLDFAHPRPSSPRPVDVKAAATAAAELVRFSGRARGVAVVVDVEDGLPLIAADPDHLQQVLVNLGMNAVDACAARDDGKGNVVVRAAIDDATHVVIDVEDDGVGIPKDLVHRVFDPFFTTKKRGSGTGLGLTIVARIAQSHGATIDVDSSPGKGTRFRVSWPVAVPSIHGAGELPA